MEKDILLHHVDEVFYISLRCFYNIISINVPSYPYWTDRTLIDSDGIVDFSAMMSPHDLWGRWKWQKILTPKTGLRIFYNGLFWHPTFFIHDHFSHSNT